MKLAVFTGQTFWFDGKHYSTDEAYIKFVTSFYPYFEKIIFCDVVAKERKTQAYVLDPRKTEVCPLPYFSVYSLWRNLLLIFPRIYRLIRDNIRNWDITWLPAPHPVGLLFVHICRRLHRPFFLIVRQNLLEQVRHRNTGVRRLCAMGSVGTLEYIYQRISEKTLTFAVGHEMYSSYKKRGGPVHKIAVSMVLQEEIEKTLSTRKSVLHKPLRLLSVGRLEPEKGLHFLIDAVDKLIKERRLKVVLQVVGKGLKRSEEEKLRWQVEKCQLEYSVRFLGHVMHGPELFKLYRDSDIFVLPSLTGEGIPQTLFEAMACGIPFVATKVAGIPYMIEDGENGLLIDPGSPREICDVVERLVSDSKLRDRLRRNGLSAVKSHTLEAERDRIIYRIQDFLEQAEA
jgi:glycosyltransferase involved in cell wall biosynthesis